MKAMHLDFVRTRRPASPLAILLLLVGLAAAVFALLQEFRDVRPKEQQLQRQLAGQQHSLDSLNARSQSTRLTDPDLAAGIAAANKVAAHLALPWNRLFDAIANASKSERVALLAIEPEAQKEQVVIVAEAADVAAMLKFVRALQASRDLSEVVLKSHSLVASASESHVQFRLNAHWILPP